MQKETKRKKKKNANDWMKGNRGQCFFLKWANPGHFFILFLSFQTNITIFTTHKCEKFPYSIRCWDSNPRPLEHESPPITTIPGLSPMVQCIVASLMVPIGRSLYCTVPKHRPNKPSVIFYHTWEFWWSNWQYILAQTLLPHKN